MSRTFLAVLATGLIALPAQEQDAGAKKATSTAKPAKQDKAKKPKPMSIGMARFSGAYADLAESPFAPGYAPPGGETWEVFHERVDRAWARIREVAAPLSGHLAVVTHGLVCHSLVSRRLELPAGLGAPRGFANASLTVVEPSRPWRIRLLNCTAHLEAPAPDGAAA